jgi:hypothetical protein
MFLDLACDQWSASFITLYAIHETAADYYDSEPSAM